MTEVRRMLSLIFPGRYNNGKIENVFQIDKRGLFRTQSTGLNFIKNNTLQ